MTTRRKPRRVPPPLDHGEEIFEGEPILTELSGDVALLLWKTVRSVRLWLRLDPANRAHAFSAGAYQARVVRLRAAIASPPLLEQLETLAGVLRADPVDGAAIAGACAGVAEWAEEGGSLATAVEFMQAAAFADPGNAGLARRVALLTRCRGEYARAETWFRQAIATARQARDWPILIRSYLGLSATHTRRGNYPAARATALRALHAARRHSERELIAMAYHDLTVVSTRTDRAGEVIRYAEAALRAYGPGHARLPSLVHDVGVFWMKQGFFQQAVELFEAIPPDYGSPVDRLMRSAAIARCAGALGDRSAFGNALREGNRLLAHPAAAQGVATALMNLARGAESIGQLSVAADYATRARELAVARGEAEVTFAADAILESVRSEQRAGQAAAESGRRPPRRVVHLARDLAAALAGA